MTPVSASIFSITARERTSYPASRSASPPPWKPFSMQMPMPSTIPPACFTRSRSPLTAQPLARKSSMMRICSPGFRYFFDTTTWFFRLWVYDITSVANISLSILLPADFFAKTTGTPKYTAVRQAMPIPDASIVRILSTFRSPKSFLNSFPSSLIKGTSI